MTSVIILSTGILFFLIQPLLLIINKIRLKGKFNFRLIYLSLLGLALAINNIMLISKAFEYLYYRSENVQIFILINIIISLLSLASAIAFLILKKKRYIAIFGNIIKCINYFI